MAGRVVRGEGLSGMVFEGAADELLVFPLPCCTLAVLTPSVVLRACCPHCSWCWVDADPGQVPQSGMFRAAQQKVSSSPVASNVL